jgi:hypothetical protein
MESYLAHSAHGVRGRDGLVPHSRETDKGEYVEDEMNSFLHWFSMTRWIRNSLGRGGLVPHSSETDDPNDAELLEKESLEESLEDALEEALERSRSWRSSSWRSRSRGGEAASRGQVPSSCRRQIRAAPRHPGTICCLAACCSALGAICAAPERWVRFLLLGGAAPLQRV